MPVLFSTKASGPDQLARDAIRDRDGRPSRYLTDGVDLYRFLGRMAGRMGEIIGLENCRSLDVVLCPIGELRAGRLRGVTPAGE